jgi:hypothetical protein
MIEKAPFFATWIGGHDENTNEGYRQTGERGSMTGTSRAMQPSQCHWNYQLGLATPRIDRAQVTLVTFWFAPDFPTKIKILSPRPAMDCFPRLVFATIESGFNKSLGSLCFQGSQSRKEEGSARHCMHDEETPILKPLTESRIDRSLPTCGKGGEGVTYTWWAIPSRYQTTFQGVFPTLLMIPQCSRQIWQPVTRHVPTAAFGTLRNLICKKGEGSWGYAGSLPSVGKSGSPST